MPLLGHNLEKTSKIIRLIKKRVVLFKSLCYINKRSIFDSF